MTSLAMQAPALMLNKNWIPIRVTTALSAIIKVFEGSARVVNPDDYQTYDFDSWAALDLKKDDLFFRTSRLSIPVPSVIVLAKYGEIPDRKLAFSRSNIYKRDQYTCQYCGAKPGTAELTIDHIIPRVRGGQSTWTNCVLACVKCNRRKADKPYQAVPMHLAKLPVKPKWSPRLVLARVTNIPSSWEKFVDSAYWNVELKD